MILRRLAIVCLAILLMPFGIIIAFAMAVRIALRHAPAGEVDSSPWLCPRCAPDRRELARRRVLEHGPGRETVEAPYDVLTCPACRYSELYLVVAGRAGAR